MFHGLTYTALALSPFTADAKVRHKRMRWIEMRMDGWTFLPISVLIRYPQERWHWPWWVILGANLFSALLFPWLIKCNVIMALSCPSAAEIWWAIRLEHRIAIKSHYRMTIHIESWELQYISYQHLSVGISIVRSLAIPSPSFYLLIN
jgi:hypothetical protein